jgi:hypothetical protein
MSDEAVPTSRSPEARAGRRRLWTAAAAWPRAVLRLRQSSPLRGVAAACAARVRRSWLYRILVGMSAELRRCAPALCTVALLGLVGSGVWARLDQYSEQRRVNSSAQAAQPERSSGSGITPPGRPTDLTRSAGRASSERQIIVPSQRLPGEIETGSSSSISRLATRIAAALLEAAQFLLRLLLDFWLVLPAALVSVVLVWLHRRRRSRRLQNESVPLPALDNAGRERREGPVEALDAAETDLVEASEILDPVEEEEEAAGLLDAADDSARRGNASAPPARAAAVGPVASTHSLVEPEEARAGERHTVAEPEAAQAVRDVVSRHDEGTSRPREPEAVPPEESAYFATSRVSIIGTTIWASEKPTGPAQVPTQSRNRAGTGPARRADVQQATSPQQQDAPAGRLIDQQDALRRRQRAAAQRALRVRA